MSLKSSGDPMGGWVEISALERLALLDSGLTIMDDAHPRTDNGRVVTVWGRHGVPVMRDFVYLPTGGKVRGRCEKRG